MIIPGFDKYDISEDGVVTRVDTGKTLKQYLCTMPNGHQYLHVSLVDANRGVAVPHNIIRLLAITYLPPRPRNYVACAKDGNNLNIKASNVEWRDRATLSHIHSNPNRRKRTSIHCTDETKAQLLEAMMALDDITTMASLAAILEVPYSTIRYSMLALLNENKVYKTTAGYGVIK